MAFILIGNKSDIPEERVVFEEKIKEFAAEYELKYIETSAKVGTNIDYAFDILLKDILAKNVAGSILNANGEETEIKVAKKPEGIKLSQINKEKDHVSDISQCQC